MPVRDNLIPFTTDWYLCV